MRTVTGFAGSNVSPPDMPTLVSLSMGHPNDSVPRDLRTISVLSIGQPNDSGPYININIAISQMSSQQAESSHTLMEDDGPRSPSILDNVHPSLPANRDRSPEGDSNLGSGLRGRSPIRRAVDNKRTQTQSTAQSQHVEPFLILSLEAHSRKCRSVLRGPPTLKSQLSKIKTSSEKRKLSMVSIQNNLPPTQSMNNDNRTFRENVPILLQTALHTNKIARTDKH